MTRESAFNLVEQKHYKHVVIPDLHGEDELAKKVVDLYFDEADICFVFLGDILDKHKAPRNDRGVFNTVELIKNLGSRAILTIANHEWATLGTLYDESRERQSAHEIGARNFYGNKTTLESYDVNPQSINAKEDLIKAFIEAGHDKVLMGAVPYYETEKFIAVHAGVEHHWDWEEQREYLIDVAREMANGIYERQPSAWFSTELAADIKPVSSTDKVVVSGHAHNLSNGLKSFKYPIKTSTDRIVNDGQRIRLASQLNNSCDPLFIWQDWDGKIIQISRH